MSYGIILILSHLISYSLLRFCALRRGDEAHVYRLGDELDTSCLHGRLTAIISSMVCFGIIVQQSYQLPDDFLRLGFQQRFSDQTTIAFMDGYVQKTVDLACLPQLESQLGRLMKLYKDVQGSECIVQVVEEPKISEGKYKVSIRPRGHQLSGPPSQPDKLKAAIRCWIKGLQSLHATGTGHGDVRWPNLIHMKDTEVSMRHPTT